MIAFSLLIVLFLLTLLLRGKLLLWLTILRSWTLLKDAEFLKFFHLIVFLDSINIAHILPDCEVKVEDEDLDGDEPDIKPEEKRDTEGDDQVRALGHAVVDIRVMRLVYRLD